jgi:hypothetical protein
MEMEEENTLWISFMAQETYHLDAFPLSPILMFQRWHALVKWHQSDFFEQSI